ncbi:MAG TPA: hypothetical protein VGO50_20865 [Pyrinomonadaceae bacterium]|jgi:hypothetical protein|nr:hypothetical protein [Pyrinomonadaceae bacterium]
MDENLKYLRYLSIGNYVYAPLLALCALFPVLHLTIGIAIVTEALSGTNKPKALPAVLVGWFFIGVSSFIILSGMALAVCNALAGRFIKQHKRYVFCFAIAIVNCMFPPIGTMLGVFTILVLMREPVKQLFGLMPQNELRPAMGMTTPPDWR